MSSGLPSTGFLSVPPLRICSVSPTRLTSSLGLRAVQFFFLGAGVDLGFASDPICFLFPLVFYACCASSELPKVKSIPKSPSFLWIFDVCWMILFRCGVFTLVSMRCFCFIVVNILVDHEELELAYDANIYTIRFTVTIHRFTIIIHQRGSQSLIRGHNTNTKFSMSQFTRSQYQVTVTVHSLPSQLL